MGRYIERGLSRRLQLTLRACNMRGISCIEADGFLVGVPLCPNCVDDFFGRPLRRSNECGEHAPLSIRFRSVRLHEYRLTLGAAKRMAAHGPTLPKFAASTKTRHAHVRRRSSVYVWCRPYGTRPPYATIVQSSGRPKEFRSSTEHQFHVPNPAFTNVVEALIRC